MSIQTITEVTCDCCGLRVAGYTGTRTNHIRARDNLKRLGWTVRTVNHKLRDLCTTCTVYLPKPGTTNTQPLAESVS